LLSTLTSQPGGRRQENHSELVRLLECTRVVKFGARGIQLKSATISDAFLNSTTSQKASDIIASLS
jgi:hypothetical protein